MQRFVLNKYCYCVKKYNWIKWKTQTNCFSIAWAQALLQLNRGLSIYFSPTFRICFFCVCVCGLLFSLLNLYWMHSARDQLSIRKCLPCRRCIWWCRLVGTASRHPGRESQNLKQLWNIVLNDEVVRLMWIAPNSPNSSSMAMTTSTWSSESSPRSLIKCESGFSCFKEKTQIVKL